MGLCGILFVIFITMKLTGYVAWSWFWVFLPFVIGLIIDIIAVRARLKKEAEEWFGNQ